MQAEKQIIESHEFFLRRLKKTRENNIKRQDSCVWGVMTVKLILHIISITQPIRV